MIKKQLRRRRKAVDPFWSIPIVLFMVLVGVGIGWVRVSAKCGVLEGELKGLEFQLGAMHEAVASAQTAWSNMLAPANFERVLRSHQLAMKLPDVRQIVHVRRAGQGPLPTVAANCDLTHIDAL